MNWSETPYPVIALVVGFITLIHCFSNHRRAWVSRISALLLVVSLLTTLASGDDGVGTSGAAFWVVVVGVLGFAGLTVLSVIIALYDALFTANTKTVTKN